MPRPRFPRWFTYLTAVALFCLAACWIAAAILAFGPNWEPPDPRIRNPGMFTPQTPYRLFFLGIATFGIAMTLATIHIATAGWLYFFPQRRYITRSRDPRLFWTFFAFLITLTLAHFVFGIYHLL